MNTIIKIQSFLTITNNNTQNILINKSVKNISQTPLKKEKNEFSKNFLFYKDLKQYKKSIKRNISIHYCINNQFLT